MICHAWVTVTDTLIDNTFHKSNVGYHDYSKQDDCTLKINSVTQWYEYVNMVSKIQRSKAQKECVFEDKLNKY